MSLMPSRRRFMAGALGSAAAGLSALPARGAEQKIPHPVDVTSKEGALKQLIRVLGHEGGGDVLYWFHGSIYAVAPGQRPFPMVHFNGINAMRFTQQDDGSYFSRHHSISYMEDRERHELLRDWTNPLTGKVVTPEPNVFKGSVYDYSVKGTKMRAGTWDTAVPLDPGMWTFGKKLAWITIDRPYAARFGYPWSEARTYEVQLEDLVNPAKKSLLGKQHSTVTNPFPRWMGMKDQPGFALWQANGQKLANAGELPTHLLERCRTYMPELFDYDVFG
ncbi:MAG: DUF1838 family protein [Pseudomonadota bacterium]